MKEENKKLVHLKYKLENLKDRRIKIVIWKLTKEEREYIESLGYRVEPYLYEIRTQTSKNLSQEKSSLIRELHYANKKGKKTIVLKLNRKDMKVLEEHHIKYRPIKFEIFLVQSQQ